MVQTLWDSITEFLAGGDKRTEALQEGIRENVTPFVPPNLREPLGLLAEVNPVQDIYRAGGNMRGGNYVDAGVDTAIAAAPVVGGVLGRVGANQLADTGGDAARAAMDTLLGGAPGRYTSAVDAFAERANQRGPVPTMYSNPISLWHGSPYDFDSFSLEKVGTGEGAQDLGRGFSLTDEEAISHLYTNPASRWGDLDAMQRYSQAGPGRYYNVLVDAEETDFLDWNKPWRDQVKQDTLLFDALKSEENRLLQTYGDDPAMVEAIPKAKLSQVWRDKNNLEDAAMKSGYAGNLRQNYSGDTEYTVFDPDRMQIAKKFDKDGNEIPLPQPLPTPRNDAEAVARDILDMRAAGRAGDVTDEMMAAADDQYMFANTPLPMDEASRMARADEGWPADAYHATSKDFEKFKPSEFRGASFFAPTPDGAMRGASASSNEGVGSGTGLMLPVRLNTSGVEGLGAYSRRDMNEFRRGLESRFYTEEEMDALMEGADVPHWARWNTFFDDLTDYDALSAFRDKNPDAKIPEGIIRYKPKDPVSYGPGIRRDISGREFAHYSDGMSERPTSDYVNSQGNTGFTMQDESGLAVGMTDPRNIRSRFARFDPEFSHLRNLSAGVAGGGLLATQDTEQQREEEIRQYLGGLL